MTALPRPQTADAGWPDPAADPPPRDAAMARCLGRLGDVDDLARTLPPLLEALGWEGAPRALAEALPHMEAQLDLTALRDTMALLGHASSVLRDTRADRIDARLLPALLVARDGRAVVLLRPGPARGQGWVHDPRGGGPELRALRRLRGDICVFAPPAAPSEARRAAEAGRWTRFLLARFRGVHATVAALTLVIYLLAVAPALFIMAVYDRVIPAQSPATLAALLVGVALALLGEGVLRGLRGRLLARLGGRLGLLMAGGLFAHLLAMPVPLSERMRMGARMQRLRQAEALRDALAGPAAITAIELPFAAVFLVALAAIAGPLALVPLAAVGIYGLAALALAPALRRASEAAARTGLDRQDFLLEAIAHAEDIRLAGAAPRWRARFRDLSGAAAWAGHRTQMLAALTTAIGQVVMVGAGLLTVGFGAAMAMAGTLSTGALIAVMTLAWRALAPIQAGFVLLTRLEPLRGTAAGLDRAMQAPQEPCALAHPKDTAPVTEGRLSLRRVSFKYAPDLEPAAMALSAEIAPGEIVAVTGPNGAGKSTMLKLVLGLYAPQAGSILIDGIDIRQHAPGALRQAIGHVPQDCELFFGTVAQNLALAMPTATAAQIRAAVARAGIDGMIRRLPGGLDHRVGDGRSRHVPSGLVVGLALAGAYLRAPRVLLLDEAIDTLDPDQTAALHRQIVALRGRVTVVMVTHRPATMRLADRVLVLNAGSVVKAGPPATLMGPGPAGPPLQEGQR